MNVERLITLSLIVLAASLSRLVPHPYNFAPITAIALFGAAKFERKWEAFVIPALVLLLSDAIIGFYPQMGVTYFAFAVIACIGFGLRNHQGSLPVLAATLGSSVLFYLITNFALWLPYDLYPATVEGVMESYIAALPFFKNTLAGDVFYAALLFGGFALAERRFTRLQPGRPMAA